EQYVEAHGLKKGQLIEMALLHHLQALSELPADVVIPPRIVVTPKSFEQIMERVEHPKGPTAAMRALFEDKDL
ncbi:MAG: hypothetical protein AAGJ35_05945, partial [Myxococcota bacterium]